MESRTRQNRTLRSTVPCLLEWKRQRDEGNVDGRSSLFMADGDRFDNDGSSLLRRCASGIGQQIAFFDFYVRQHADGVACPQLGSVGNPIFSRRRFYDFDGNKFGHFFSLYRRNVRTPHFTYRTFRSELQFLREMTGSLYSNQTLSPPAQVPNARRRTLSIVLAINRTEPSNMPTFIPPG